MKRSTSDGLFVRRVLLRARRSGTTAAFLSALADLRWRPGDRCALRPRTHAPRRYARAAFPLHGQLLLRGLRGELAQRFLLTAFPGLKRRRFDRLERHARRRRLRLRLLRHLGPSLL